MGVPKLPQNGISWALYVGDFLLEGVSQWTPCPNGPQSPLLSDFTHILGDAGCSEDREGGGQEGAVYSLND